MQPEVVTTRAELAAKIATVRRTGKSIGLVPTMGALHEGHLSLIDASRRRCNFTIATVFVNPTQFGPTEDFSKYPRTLEADLALLGSRHTDLVFAPSKEEMYPGDFATSVEVRGVALLLEGQFRPVHFSGVATVVLKLFNTAPADVAFFGRKDYQQTLVVRQMVADLNVPIEIEVCPIVREADGLALSSRNVYLSASERARALSLSSSLRTAAERVAAGERDAAAIRAEMVRQLEAHDVRVDYVALADPSTLAPVSRIEQPTVALIAGRVGATRLIDNEILTP